MANLELQIQEFLKINDTDSDYGYGDSSGFGSGYDSGFGSGYDSGSGYGSGYGDGSDYGDGSGFGVGSGSGDDDGDDYGYGSGDGYGDGSGSDYGADYGYNYSSGYGISKINNLNVYRIDDVATIITNVKGNVAKGFILRVDLTLEPCFIAKGNNLFAHGSTIKEAVKSLQDKIFENLPVEERINEFTKHFKKDKKYKGSIFFEWHNKLTGSCEMGRKSFVENNGLSLEDEYTVKQFIALTKNSYGGEIIRKLEKYYEERK